MIKQGFTRVSTMLLTMIAVVAAAITTPITTAIAQEIFESEELGFRMQVPEGWVAQDVTREEGIPNC
jgi:hypothetical protein